MNRILCLVLVLMLALGLTACGDEGAAITNDPANATRGNRIGDRCIAATMTEIDQNGFTDRTLDPTATGKITVINFWAYWCGPCVNELPHFNEVAREMADTVTVVAIHCDTVESAQTFIRDNYPDSVIRFAMDQKNPAYTYYSALGGSGSIPYTVVLDADGIIRHTFTGAISRATLLEAIRDCGG